MTHDGPVEDVFAQQVIALYGPLTALQSEVLAEIGGMRYQAICHFVSDAEFKADHQSDCAGAISEYAKALSLLVTIKARRVFAGGILESLRDLAAEAEDSSLTLRVKTLIAAFEEEIAGRSPLTDR